MYKRQAIGEGVKGVDKLTDKKLLSFYPGMDWKGVMGMRDIIDVYKRQIKKSAGFSVSRVSDMYMSIFKKVLGGE